MKNKNYFLIYLSIITILVMSIYLFNNTTYKFDEPISIDDDMCSEVYIEPYNIFSYRYKYGISITYKTTKDKWFLESGEVVDMEYIPYQEIYLEHIQEAELFYYSLVYPNYEYSVGLDEELGKNLVEKGVSTDKENPTIYTDVFIDENGNVYDENEVAGKIESCKE